MNIRLGDHSELDSHRMNMIKIAFVVRIISSTNYQNCYGSFVSRFALQLLLPLRPRLMLVSCMEPMAMVLVSAMLDLDMVQVLAMLVSAMGLVLAMLVLDMELVSAMLVLDMVLVSDMLVMLPVTVSPMLPTL